MIKKNFRRSRWAMLGTALLAATAIFSSLPAAASAESQVNWNCNPLNPGVWCSTAVARNFIENGVAENYAGSVGMCVKSVRQSNGTQYQGMACGYNAVAVRYTTYCNCGGLYALHNHSASGQRNIYGYALYPG